ncbi:very short patch repair endonuclease [Pandoraea terrae]|uniref:Very short patch repair endonuclease n=2 Tax=Pandoraea terrae TaxID=1537710 RepID=A0A5E4THX5_9BURK|nr:very short patch repair endonuclease [Pandoraea terrae]
MDIVDANTRSQMMSGIRAKDTKPEMIVRRFLHSNGFRYRLHDRKLPGTPDLVLPKYRAVIFVHGCFWHHHPDCDKAYIPASDTEKWMHKFQTNRTRDERNVTLLTQMGWHVIVVWECELSARRAASQLNGLKDSLHHLQVTDR